MSGMHSFIQFQFKTTKTKTKLQTGIVTEKVIQQLNAEPKVVITANSALRASISKSDRNVPNTSVYHDKHNQNVSSKNQNGDDSAIDEIESELGKMFCCDNEPSTIHKEPSKVRSKPHKNRKVPKENLRELLIRLFGSPLDDIELNTQPKKIEKIARRHTLPVSIPRELLTPVKVSQKRKSANATLCQNQNKPTVCALPEFEVTQPLTKEETIRQRIRPVVVTNDFEVATIMEEPQTGVSETVNCDVTIDLTEEDSDSEELVIDTSTEEEVVKEEPSISSETASVPAQAPSMPLLPPVSPAQATQREATLPETSNTSQRPPPHIPVMVAPKPPVPRARVPTKRPYQDGAPESQPVQPAKRPSQMVPPSNHMVPSSNQMVPPSNQMVPPSNQMVPPSNQMVLPSNQLVLPSNQMVPPSNEMVPPSNQMLPPSNQETVPPSNQPARFPSIPATRPPAVAESTQQISSVPDSARYQQAPQDQASPLSTHAFFSNLQNMLQADKTKQAPERRHSIEQSAASNIPRVTIHQSGANLSQTRPQEVQLKSTVSCIMQTAQCPTIIPQMFVQVPRYPVPNRGAPPLIRMQRPTRSQFEFQLISNAACGERILPHVATMARWKDSAIRFCEEVQTYLTPNDWRQDYSVFCIYINQTMTNFGKKLIRDLATVEVENFDLGEVCTVISRRLQEQNCSASIYRVCVNIHAMIKSCEDCCGSPFTKKFFYNVKACVEKMEEKTRKGRQAPTSFTVSQLKQLEMQIQQYIHIQRWLDFTCASSNRLQPRPHHRTTLKKQQKKATDAKQNMQHTMLRAMLLHQNAPDQPVAPPAQSVEKSQSQPQIEPVRVVVPQPPLLPAEVPPVLQQSPSREASVIVFTPTEENRAEAPRVATKPEQKQDEIIDLTWIDDGDESVMLEEIAESKTFPCKIEIYPENEAEEREVVSPADSGLGSPHSQTDEAYKCLCGKQAIYVCACQCSMYCGRECQMNDWADHQKWCGLDSAS